MSKTDRMIITRKEVEIEGRTVIMESHLPNPDWQCECGNNHAMNDFLYHAANFQLLLERIVEVETGEQREKSLADAWTAFKEARDKAFPEPDYSKISSILLNGVEFGPETETFKAYYRLRNGGREYGA